MIMQSVTSVKRVTSHIALFITGILLSTSVRAELILTAPPRETAEAGQKLYGPLAEHLSIVIGQQVSYVHPGDWRNYQREMQAGKYAIIFDGPHFAAWRVDKQMHYPAVKLPGKMKFVLVTRKDRGDITSAADLVGKKVCALPSPNLATLTLYSMYPNPMQQPRMVFTQTGGPKAVASNFINNACDGAILRKSLYEKKLSTEYRAMTHIIAERGVKTNQGITVSRELGEATLNNIISGLSSDAGRQAMKPILERFTKKNEYHVASFTDYEGQNLLIDNMIFGW